MVVPVAIALGSNLGERERYLLEAVEALSASVSNLQLSTFYETDPVGVGDQHREQHGEQPRFVNAAAIGRTTLSARALLAAMLEIERQSGRERPYPGAPRTLDLDLILYGDAVIGEPDLVVPHPRFRERRFVLEPLAEVASGWIDPVTGLTVGQLLDLAKAL